MTDVQKQNIENMRLQGMGYKRIAGSLGLPLTTIKSFCQRNKLEAASVVTEIAENEAVCKHCGKVMERLPKRKPKTFCDDKCRYDYWNINATQRETARHTVCACCGVAFVSYGNRIRKYCGHSCYINHRFPKEAIVCEQGAI